MIGFDVICLASSSFSSHERMLRYANKILTRSELERWSLRGNDPVELWRYWGMKESAYKAESRQPSLRQFCPKRFEISFTTRETACISAPGQTYQARAKQNDDCMWVVAVSDSFLVSEVHAEVFALSSSKPASQSAEVRQRIRMDFPHVHEDQIIHHSPFLSISHHGLWGGYAIYQQPVS